MVIPCPPNVIISVLNALPLYPNSISSSIGNDRLILKVHYIIYRIIESYHFTYGFRLSSRRIFYYTIALTSPEQGTLEVTLEVYKDEETVSQNLLFRQKWIIKG